ncbi:patatin family protein [Bacillus spongiae]|uniref:Patatin family protein n=1 Tax=Bacillus spongiae TaxID=2683610 RepID=A0ABU8HHM7_9BACI
MQLHNIGLVLEGGGMRGVYTAGVLEAFLENDIEFPYLIGVSAGACNAASYLSKQKGRNKKVNIGFIKDPKYLSWRNYWKKRELFGMDFVFNTIPNQLVPYDYDAFRKNKAEFIIGTTDCQSGEPLYFSRKEYTNDLLRVLRATASLPFVAPTVNFQSNQLLDGGIADPIPIRKAEADGFSKNIVILTRNEGYRKKPSRFSFYLKRKYNNFPNLIETMQKRHLQYNQSIKYIEEQEKRGNVMIIRPKHSLKVGRMERDPEKLTTLYEDGYEDGLEAIERMDNFIEPHHLLEKY